jgi:hypothetical protein
MGNGWFDEMARLHDALAAERAAGQRMREALGRINNMTQWAGQWAVDCDCMRRIPEIGVIARAALAGAPRTQEGEAPAPWLNDRCPTHGNYRCAERLGVPDVPGARGGRGSLATVVASKAAYENRAAPAAAQGVEALEEAARHFENAAALSGRPVAAMSAGFVAQRLRALAKEKACSGAGVASGSPSVPSSTSSGSPSPAEPSDGRCPLCPDCPPNCGCQHDPPEHRCSKCGKPAFVWSGGAGLCADCNGARVERMLREEER